MPQILMGLYSWPMFHVKHSKTKGSAERLQYISLVQFIAVYSFPPVVW